MTKRWLTRGTNETIEPRRRSFPFNRILYRPEAVPAYASESEISLHFVPVDENRGAFKAPKSLERVCDIEA